MRPLRWPLLTVVACVFFVGCGPSVSVTVQVDEQIPNEGDLPMGLELREGKVYCEEDGAEMVYIPEGPFKFGPNKEDIHVQTYYIDRYEVTNALYKKFTDATYHVAAPFMEDEKLGAPDMPVVGVTWDDAAAYAKWAGKQLPTDQQWEKAARSIDGWTYPWGDDEPVPARACYDAKAPSPVGSFPGGTSRFGCFDMAGNVQEWIVGHYDAQKTRRAARGGSWKTRDPQFLCVCYRSPYPGDEVSNTRGFRCCFVPKKKK